MSEETLKWFLPLLISGIIGAFTIIGNIWIQRHKSKSESSSAKITAEDNFRDDLLQQNKELFALDRIYRDELRQMEARYRDELLKVETRYREQLEKTELKYDQVLSTMREMQTENAELKSTNKQLVAENKQLSEQNKQISAKVSELQSHVARLEQQQREQKYG